MPIPCTLFFYQLIQPLILFQQVLIKLTWGRRDQFIKTIDKHTAYRIGWRIPSEATAEWSQVAKRHYLGVIRLWPCGILDKHKKPAYVPIKAPNSD
ncbi:MAG TPA: hypothetical protein DCS63_09400 [Elusimicrobia bacterium]|nr:hypothetical protein [Elusimicrobiota bacterium]